MKAALITDKCNMIVDDVDKPEPKEGQVRIKVDLAGICGSDNALFHGKCNVPFPVIGGHEAVGKIEKLGSGVTEFEIGQRVTIHPNYFCGECELCQKKLPNLCKHKVRLGIDINGVFAEYVVVHAKQVIKIPDDMPNEIAVFTEPLAVAVHALNQASPKKNDKVLIVGAGVMGLITLQLAIEKQAQVTICDLEPKKIEMALKLGASDKIGPNDKIDSFYNQFDIIYETSGAPSTLSEAIKLAAPGGQIVVLGLPAAEHPMPTQMVVRKELRIIGSMIYQKDEFYTALEILQEGRLDVNSLTSGELTLNELNHALADFSSPDRIKTLVNINTAN